MSKIEHYYEAINPDTKKTKYYKIVEDNKRFEVFSYKQGMFSSYVSIKANLESKQSAIQIMRNDAKNELGQKTLVNLIIK